MSEAVGESMAVQFAKAVAPMAEAVGAPVPSAIATQAPQMMEELPPDDMARFLADLLGRKDGSRGLFVRNSEIIAWDDEAQDFSPMTAKRFRTWLPSTTGLVIVRKRVPLKDADGNHTGEFVIVKGGLTKDRAEVVLASDELRCALPKIAAFHPVQLPVWREVGQAPELLPVGYDVPTQIFTRAAVTYDHALDVRDAMEWWYNIFRTFGWRNESRDLAIHLAAQLSVYARMLYEGRPPAFAYIANERSSGKTNLAWSAVWAVYGTRKIKPLMEDAEQQLEDTLNSMALEQVGYTIFDNVKWGRPVESPLLDQWISGSEWDFRRKHTNSMVAPTLCGVTLFTGNEMKLSPDLQRRTLDCDLWNPLRADERPKVAGMVTLTEAWFKAQENRAMMLATMWSIVRHWHESGRMSGTRELGTFEGWSDVVPGMVLATGRVFAREWDCMQKNSNEGTGDKKGRDFRRLGELAMTELGVDERGEPLPRFEVTVASLAGVARRHGVEEATFHLYPEKDIESVMDTEGRSGGWHFKSPPPDEYMSEEDERALRVRQASEWLTPKTRSSFGLALKEQLEERWVRHKDGSHYLWRRVAGATPARYACERAEVRKA